MSQRQATKEQQQIIEATEGNIRVRAVPGSGKTFTITHRIKYLTEECRVNPSSILVITFTKAAATEMKERYESLCGGGPSSVSFGTFHAIFFRILKFAYRYDARNIVRDEQRMQYIRELIETNHVEVSAPFCQRSAP